jgi:hypothetical protein
MSKPEESAIDHCLRLLGDQLPGPVRHKRGLLAEARDGLRDAAQAYQEAGLDAVPTSYLMWCQHDPRRPVTA